jgi:hypothetical protein
MVTTANRIFMGLAAAILAACRLTLNFFILFEPQQFSEIFP